MYYLVFVFRISDFNFLYNYLCSVIILYDYICTQNKSLNFLIFVIVFKIYISDYNCVTPLGFDVASNWEALQNNQSGIRRHKIARNSGEIFASVIDNAELDDFWEKNFGEKKFTRFEKMLIISLKPIVEKNPVSEKSILILSTTKGNISEIRNQTSAPETAFLFHSAQKIADFFGFETKPIVVSNACVSGVMAVSVGKTLLESGQYENAYILAGDEVTEFVISGFKSFQAMSSELCKPYDKNRSGITIGEASAALFLTKEKSDFKILGTASVNDANHISGPSRTGEGLFKSISNALKEAEILPEKIDYISAHGTATLYNDEMEAIAFNRLKMNQIPINSLKAYYGHCLGASGLLEIIIALESSKNSTLIATKNFEKIGVSQPLNIIEKNQQKQIQTFLKTASGFGGSNSAIVIRKTHPNGKNL